MKPALILGTVQLGMPYGIANIDGQPDQESATAILEAAVDGGIRFFDTAQGYGESEKVLGTALNRLNASVYAKIITKLSPTLEKEETRIIADSIAGSMDRLGVKELYCCMLHRESHLSLINGKVGVELQKVVEKGKIEKIGISVYTPEVAIEALQHPAINVVQVPASVFDRRFEQAGVFDLAAQLGKELHIRSVLLQGVLCMEPTVLPSYLRELSPELIEWRKLCREFGFPPSSAALAFACQRWSSAFVIFGAEKAEQVRANVSFLLGMSELPADFCSEAEKLIPPQKPALLNPALWGK